MFCYGCVVRVRVTLFRVISRTILKSQILGNQTGNKLKMSFREIQTFIVGALEKSTLGMYNDTPSLLMANGKGALRGQKVM